MSRGTLAEVLSLTPKRALSDDVVVRLRDAISSGQLAPGERLSEELLAEMVGISRGPIREALTQLEREGLVIKQRNKGTFVARLSREDLDEVYSLRLALEKLAMQQVILTADSKHLVEMQAIVDEMAADVSANPTPQTEAELDLRFHDILYQASKHRRLCDCWATICQQICIFLLTRNVADPDFRQVTVQGHQDIVDAIRAKDEERAITVIASHLQSAYERIVKSYSQSGGSGADHFPPIDQHFRAMPPNLFDLTGRVAVVTGAASGLGQAMAIGLAQFGAEIAAADINDADLERTVERVMALGRKAVAIHCDISQPDDVAHLFEIVDQVFGRVDILVNDPFTLARYKPEDLESLLRHRFSNVGYDSCRRRQLDNCQSHTRIFRSASSTSHPDEGTRSRIGLQFDVIGD